MVKTVKKAFNKRVSRLKEYLSLPRVQWKQEPVKSDADSADKIPSKHEIKDTFRKRRSRCGICPPCLVKENCGSCKECINRSIGKQACRFRKCERLGKRRQLCTLINAEQRPCQRKKGQKHLTKTSGRTRNLALVRKKKRSAVQVKESPHLARLQCIQKLQTQSLNRLIKNEVEGTPPHDLYSNFNRQIGTTGRAPAVQEHLYSSLGNKHVNGFKAETFVSEAPTRSVVNCIQEQRLSSGSGNEKIKIEDAPHYSSCNGATLRTTACNVDIKKEESASPSLSQECVKTPLPPVILGGEKFEFQAEPPKCGCNAPADSGPYYSHLGCARTYESLRASFERRLQVSGKAINIRLIKPTGKEGKNHAGCPLARWVIRRTSEEEKYLVVARKRPGHVCPQSYLVTVMVVWEGITKDYADAMYKYLTANLNEYGFTTRRRCGMNESKTCMCQGGDTDTQGASFSFGCSWSMFFNGCKFAKSTEPRKFKMQDSHKEGEIEQVFQTLADHVSPLLKKCAPQAYTNMTHHENEGSECRIGYNQGRPFSGVTTCVDFCAHSHKDVHNMMNGTTMVCTLLKPDYDARDDEQLHVLPLYQLLDKDGNVEPPNFTIPSHFLTSKLKLRERRMDTNRLSTPVPVGRSRSTDIPVKHIKEEAASPFHSDVHRGPMSKSPASNMVPVKPEPEDFVETMSMQFGQKHNMFSAPKLIKQEDGSAARVPVVSRNSFSISNLLDLKGGKQAPGSSVFDSKHPLNPQNSAHHHPNRSLHHNSSSNDTSDPNLGEHLYSRQPKFIDERLVPSVFNYELCAFERLSNIRSGGFQDIKKPRLHYVDDTNIPIFRQHWKTFRDLERQRAMAQDLFNSICMQSKREVGGDATATNLRKSSLDSTVGNKNDFKTPSKKGQRYKRLISALNLEVPQQTTITEDMGGVAIALGHGSFLIECARQELHATTALRNPQRNSPTRISMVFYQHKALNRPNHAFEYWQEKVRLRKEEQTQAELLERERAAKEMLNFSDLSMLADAAASSQSSEDELSFDGSPAKRSRCEDELLAQIDRNRKRHSSSVPNIPPSYDDSNFFQPFDMLFQGLKKPRLPESIENLSATLPGKSNSSSYASDNQINHKILLTNSQSEKCASRSPFDGTLSGISNSSDKSVAWHSAGPCIEASTTFDFQTIGTENTISRCSLSPTSHSVSSPAATLSLKTDSSTESIKKLNPARGSASPADRFQSSPVEASLSRSSVQGSCIKAFPLSTTSSGISLSFKADKIADIPKKHKINMNSRNGNELSFANGAPDHSGNSLHFDSPTHSASYKSKQPHYRKHEYPVPVPVRKKLNSEGTCSDDSTHSIANGLTEGQLRDLDAHPRNVYATDDCDTPQNTYDSYSRSEVLHSSHVKRYQYPHARQHLVSSSRDPLHDTERLSKFAADIMTKPGTQIPISPRNTLLGPAVCQSFDSEYGKQNLPFSTTKSSSCSSPKLYSLIDLNQHSSFPILQQRVAEFHARRDTSLSPSLSESHLRRSSLPQSVSERFDNQSVKSLNTSKERVLHQEDELEFQNVRMMLNRSPQSVKTNGRNSLSGDSHPVSHSIAKRGHPTNKPSMREGLQDHISTTFQFKSRESCSSDPKLAPRASSYRKDDEYLHSSHMQPHFNASLVRDSLPGESNMRMQSTKLHPTINRLAEPSVQSALSPAPFGMNKPVFSSSISESSNPAHFHRASWTSTVQNPWSAERRESSVIVPNKSKKSVPP